MSERTPHTASQAAPIEDLAAYQDLHDLIEEFSGYEEIGTDDLLAAVLPLLRQVAEWHEGGKVGPFDGVEGLRAYRGRLYIRDGDARDPVLVSDVVERIQGMGGALDLEAAYRGLDRAASGVEDAEQILPRGVTPERPAFLPDYRSWEHSVGHHDPLTDIFSLGMVAASIALGLDFTEADQLGEFVAHRRRLTQINSRLHPVVAHVIERMTEPDRRMRAQDLAEVIHALENHRSATGLGERPIEPSLSREASILTELRGRLYDLSRRNKLLHYRTSSAELNLTEASTPIVLRVESIRPEQLFTWTSGVAEKIARQETVSLSEFVRFEEMDHAPGVLDRIRAQARKDRTEFGFSQLRLVIAFLSWRNLKEDPETPIRSPLLLLPVELKKRRGVRDSYELKATSGEAEVNPALRRYLKMLYDVDLPATVPVEDAEALPALIQSLAEQVTATEPGVRLETIAEPDVRALHERALRRVDLYKRRARPAGGAAKKFGDLVYSYARASWRPLGTQLYKSFVSPAPLPQRAERAAPEVDPQIALPLDPARAAMAPVAEPVVEPPARRRPRANGDSGDRHLWLVDLCSVSLANFNYRKMSLVRDFDALIEADVANDETRPLVERGSFGQLFQDAPKPIPTAVPAPPLGESWQVVPCDPTQDAAVGRARTGESYVIQGPPGAGKSQTIANLIADYVGRGKRVLFVCEKRAALDVVYTRLESLGLHHLCARVHDSQEDKKGFVLDLKQIFESWAGVEPDRAAQTARTRALDAVLRGLDTLSAFDGDMTALSEGAPIHELVSRAACASRPGGAHRLDLSGREEVREEAQSRAALRLPPAELDLLPSLADWRAGREAARAMQQALERMGSEAILARHPARFVSADASSDPELFERLTRSLDALGPHLERMEEAARNAVWSREGMAPLEALFAQIDFAARLAPVAGAGRLDFMQPESMVANRVRQETTWLREARETLAEAEAKTKIWVDKLSPEETEAGIRIARQHEGSYFGFLSGAWKDVRKLVTERAGFAQLAIKPKIVDVLEDLKDEHACAERVEFHLKEIANHIGLKEGPEALALAEERDGRRAKEGPAAQPLFDLVRQEGAQARQRIEVLATLKDSADAAREALSACFEGLETLPVDRAFAALSELRSHRDALPAFAPALRALAEAPETVRSSVRRIDARVDVIEEAIVDLAVERAMAVRPALRETSGVGVDSVAAEVGEALTEFRRANAAVLIDAQRQRFNDHISLTQRLDLELDRKMQRKRRQTLESRQDLEKELSKSTRFRSVRELMSGPAGRIISDLKPIWLMSPLSVADVLPLDDDSFDVAIFDEASQVPVEEAAPTLFRARQVIVVGDEKQLPPTNFFGAGSGEGDDDPDMFDDESESELDAASFLAQAARTLPSTLLGWHYRSRSEELIAFSNAVFYGGRLISVPSTRLTQVREPIIAQSAEDGAEFADEILARAVSFHHTPFALYEKQKNAGEAAYVAEAVRKLLKAKTKKSIGVVAFSEAQQSEIERALERLAKEDAKFRDLLEAEMEREENGQFEGLFVKNLENVQGDERDVIIVSVCYAPDSTGRMRMNFGPINRAGGEKRLNVIFSRAKEHLALISTIKADAVTNDYNTGALCLKTYLRYAEAVSRGDLAAMRRALHAVAPHASPRNKREPSALAEPIGAALRERGWEVEVGLGESAFVCDVAVRSPKDDNHRLAVLVDGPDHYGGTDALERHVTKPGVLKAFGWKTLTVLALDWRRDPDAVIERIEKALGG